MFFMSGMMEPFETLTTHSRSKGGAVIPSMVSWGAPSIMNDPTNSCRISVLANVMRARVEHAFLRVGLVGL
jgi:hypothetical protein